MATVSQIAPYRWKSEMPLTDTSGAADMGSTHRVVHQVTQVRRYADQRALFDGSRSVDRVHEDTEEVVLFDAFAGFSP